MVKYKGSGYWDCALEVDRGLPSFPLSYSCHKEAKLTDHGKKPQQKSTKTNSSESIAQIPWHLSKTPCSHRHHKVSIP